MGVVNAKIIGSLPNRSVVEIIAHNALAITDSDYHASQLINLTPYKKFTIIGYSSLNQPVKVLFSLGNTFVNSKFWNGTSWVSSVSSPAIIDGTGDRFLITSQMSYLNNIGLNNIIIQVGCSTAPTSGSVTIKILGVPN